MAVHYQFGGMQQISLTFEDVGVLWEQAFVSAPLSFVSH
jgi:hypothetical protein